MTSTRLPGSVRAYVGAWMVATLLVTTWNVLTATTQSLDLEPLLVLVVVVAVAELTELHFEFSARATASFTLIEAAVAAVLLVLPDSQAVLAVAAGALLANLLRRRPLAKVGFNTAQIGMSAYAAVGVLSLLPEVGPVVGRHGIGSLAAAMAVYVVVNSVAYIGLARVLGADVEQILRGQGIFSLMAPLGGLPIGVLGVELWASRPELVLLLVAPMATVYLAYRGVARTQDLLGQLRHDHERLDRIVAGTSDGILLLDADGTIEVWNAALTRLTGIPGPAAVGQPVERILSGVRLGDPVTGTWRISEAGATTPSLVDQAQFRHLIDGTIRTVRESHTFRFENGSAVGDVVVITDVTREQEVAELRNDFVARVSHELRTPLTPIKGFASMLLSRGEDMAPEQRQVALERIVERTDRLSALVEDLLRVTEFEQAGADAALADLGPTPQPVDLVHVAGTVARAVGAETDRAIELELPEHCRAAAHEAPLRQALRHLVDNATRYSLPDSPVTVTVTARPDRVAVAVADQGRGIPSSDHERVFEPFFRLEDPLRMTTSGVGLGLYIARRLAREMGGDVTVRSRPGKGSTFLLELPAWDGDDLAGSGRRGTEGTASME